MSIFYQILNHKTKQWLGLGIVTKEKEMVELCYLYIRAIVEEVSCMKKELASLQRKTSLNIDFY
jgi:hypothetical protein